MEASPPQQGTTPAGDMLRLMVGCDGLITLLQYLPVQKQLPYCYLFSWELNFAKMEWTYFVVLNFFVIWPKIHLKLK